MAEPRSKPEKTLTDRVKDAIDEVLEVIDGLIRPEPTYVPVRIPARAATGARGPRRR